MKVLTYIEHGEVALLDKPIEEAYRVFENKLDGVIKIAIAPGDERSKKQMQYQNLIARVKER